MRANSILLIVLCLLHAPALGQPKSRARDRNSYPPKLDGATVKVYKTAGDAKLNVYAYFPQNHKPTDKRAAIVFFFGGGWRSGTPKQFEQHCKYLAERGMVAMTADYRVSSRHRTKAVDCVRDAKSAVRWIRKHAQELGVDPDRIAAGGGSAGGHIAACTGTITDFDEQSETKETRSTPNAMVLFNPAVILAPIEGQLPISKDRMDELRNRMGVDPQELSPFHHLQAGQPATIIFHGEADKTVPYLTAKKFAERMRELGNKCELVGYEDQGHGFFNYGRGGGSMYRDTLSKMDAFLVAQGFLSEQASK